MKKLPIYCLLLFIASCSSNHYHDGKYKATIFTNANLTWVNDEEIELNGNEMHCTSFSVIDNKILREYKTTCKQFEDRIEYKDKNGMTVIMRPDGNGNISFGEYTYERMEGKEIIDENNSKEEEPVESMETSVKNTKTDQKNILKPDNGESLHIGAFIEATDYNPEMFDLYLKGDIYTISKPKELGRGQTICTGTFKKNGIMVDRNGKGTGFKLIEGELYRLKNNTWVKYEDQMCGL